MQCKLCKNETENYQEICNDCLQIIQQYNNNNAGVQFKALECPQCGAKLELSIDKKLASCSSCGYQHIVNDPSRIAIEIKNSYSAKNFSDLAIKYENAKNFDAALVNFEKALEIDSNNPDAWLGKARITMSIKNYQQMNFNEIDTYIDNAVSNNIQINERYLKTFELFSSFYSFLTRNDFLNSRKESYSSKKQKDSFFSDSQNEKIRENEYQEFKTKTIPAYASWCNYFWKNSQTDAVGQSIYGVLVGIQITIKQLYSIDPISIQDPLILTHFGELIREIDEKFPNAKQSAKDRFSKYY
jgi:tetratricopeptide (TPR) repeat protein